MSRVSDRRIGDGITKTPFTDTRKAPTMDYNQYNRDSLNQGSGSESKYGRTNFETGRHPGKKKKMSDDNNFGSYGDHKKKSSKSRYPWLGGSKKLSW